jgi:hypothetical protein
MTPFRWWWPLLLVALAVSCKPDLATKFERVSSDTCECSLEKPTRALRLDRIVKDVDIAYSDLNADFSLALSSILREDLEDLPLREFADFMVEGMQEDPEAPVDSIVACEDLAVDGRPAILCDMKGEMTHLGIVKTPARLLALVIGVKRNAAGDRAAKRIFHSLRSTERQLDARDEQREGEGEGEGEPRAPASAP